MGMMGLKTEALKSFIVDVAVAAINSEVVNTWAAIIYDGSSGYEIASVSGHDLTLEPESPFSPHILQLELLAVSKAFDRIEDGAEVTLRIRQHFTLALASFAKGQKEHEAVDSELAKRVYEMLSNRGVVMHSLFFADSEHLRKLSDLLEATGR
jgi:hypothetical protein